MRTGFPRIIRRWIRKREDILTEFLSICFWLGLFIGAACLCVLGLIEPLLLIEVLIALVLAFLPIYSHLIKKREQTLLISFTSKYLLGKDESSLDDLLGVLIAGKWEKLRTDPIGEFFECIRGLCLKSDSEMRRRVCEALPALFKIDPQESKDLVEILRCDWDDRWKSDNRRRTIEALPHILRKHRRFVRDNLHIIDGDEVFTIIAMTEVLDIWGEEVNRKEAEKLFAELKHEMEEHQYGEAEQSAISELWGLLGLIHSNVDRGITKCEELRDSPNVYIQICVARNLKHFRKRFPERTAELMRCFLGKDRHKNVRRPVAKEDSLKCLITMLKNKKLSEMVRNIIWDLINDEDDIIRLATFDMVEQILDGDNDFGRRILAHVAKSDNLPRLTERARTLIARREG